MANNGIDLPIKKKRDIRPVSPRAAPTYWPNESSVKRINNEIIKSIKISISIYL